jgi:hypothetical protein
VRVPANLVERRHQLPRISYTPCDALGLTAATQHLPPRVSPFAAAHTFERPLLIFSANRRANSSLPSCTFATLRQKINVAELKRGLLIEVAWRAQNIFTGLCREGTVVLSDRDLIGVQFTYVDGHVCEVIGVATPGAIRYRDLTNGIEGVLLSVYVRRAKQHQHSPNQHLENLERNGRSIEVTD